MNKGLLDAITPVEINFERNRMAIGENLIKGYGIIKYAPEVKLGWLSELTQMDNILLSMLYYPNSSGELLQAVSRNIMQLRGEVNSTRDYVRQQRAEAGIENGEELIKRIDRLGESVGYFSCTVMAMGKDEKELKKSCKALEAKVVSMSLKVRTMSNLQEETYKTMSPYHVPEEKILNCTKTIMPMSTYQYGMPASSSNFTDDTGYYLGKNMRGSLICLDMWKRGGDRTNSNWVIMGIPGQGKSFFAKHLITSEFMMGTKIYIIDPEREYRQITKFMEGDIINVGGAREGKINPLQIKVSGMKEDEDAGLSDLAIHLKTVETFFEMYLPAMTQMQQAVLKDALIEVYKKSRITFDTDVSQFKSSDFPVMSDLYNYILNMKTEDGVSESVAMLLKDVAKGGDSFLWNGETTIHSDKQVVCLDTHDIQEMPDKIKKTQYYNVLTWVWEQASRNREEKCIVICDEAYLMIDQRVPQALIYLRNIAKRGRKYSVGIMIISHSVVDFLSPDIKQYGQELLGTTAYKVFFGCDGKNLKELANLYDLKEAEVEFLLAKRQRVGLVTIGSKRMKVSFELGYKAKYLTGGGR